MHYVSHILGIADRVKTSSKTLNNLIFRRNNVLELQKFNPNLTKILSSKKLENDPPKENKSLEKIVKELVCENESAQNSRKNYPCILWINSTMS